jgi:hypothetical protein
MANAPGPNRGRDWDSSKPNDSGCAVGRECGGSVEHELRRRLGAKEDESGAIAIEKHKFTLSPQAQTR